MNNLSISFRKLSREEANRISFEIKNTLNIIAYGVSDLLKYSKVYVAENSDKELMGILALRELDRSLVDFEILMVIEKFRNNGVGKFLFQTALDDVKNKKMNAYITTRNPIVIKLIKNAGFMEVKFFNLPFSVLKHEFIKIFSFYGIFEYFRKNILLHKTVSFSYFLLKK